tara:strand:+ start:82 stop:363 length:282 start_codon:yes stop_codon:yes gene_type:complete
MKLQITIEHFDGEAATYTAAPPEWVKWETKFNKSIQQADGIGVSDLLFLAYHAMKREAGGKTIKPYEIWIETVADVKAENANPKVIPSEALVD